MLLILNQGDFRVLYTVSTLASKKIGFLQDQATAHTAGEIITMLTIFFPLLLIYGLWRLFPISEHEAI